MRTLTVLPVGDGACSIVRDYSLSTPGQDSVTIIDCGQGKSHGRSAAIQLLEHMRPQDWVALSSLVVTHYDADHWRGLHFVAANLPPGALPLTVSPLVVYSPAVPFGLASDLPATVNTLISMTSPSGAEALDLQRAWAQHVPTKLVPRAAGDWMWVAGRAHHVVWPPQALGAPATTRANNVVSQIRDLAHRLASQGHPQLRDALAKAYDQQAFGRQHNGEGISPDGLDDEKPVRRPEEYLRASFGKTDNIHADTQAWGRRVISDEASNNESAVLPAALLTQAERKLVNAARRLQNYLSLVFHDPVHRSLLAYGDAPRSVVTKVKAKVHPWYQSILAPHHGTQTMPPGTSGSTWCVAQGDDGKFRDSWHRNHLPTHQPIQSYGHSLLRYRCLHVTARGVHRPLWRRLH